MCKSFSFSPALPLKSQTHWYTDLNVDHFGFISKGNLLWQFPGWELNLLPSEHETPCENNFVCGSLKCFFVRVHTKLKAVTWYSFLSNRAVIILPCYKLKYRFLQTKMETGDASPMSWLGGRESDEIEACNYFDWLVVSSSQKNDYVDNRCFGMNWVIWGFDHLPAESPQVTVVLVRNWIL